MLNDSDYMDDKGGYYELVCVAKMDSDSSLMAVYVNKQTYEYYVCPISEFKKDLNLFHSYPNLAARRMYP